MAVIRLNTPDSPETIMTTELNSLADGSNAITGTAISNNATDELDMYADFELLVATQGSARDAQARVEMYVLITLDGTNYTYGGASLDPPANAFVGSFLYDAATNARYGHIRGVPLPPRDFHILLINETGQALASSGNILKMSRYNLQST